MLLADNVAVMIWRTDRDLTYDWFNQRWLEFTGRSLEEAIGPRGWIDLVHPRHAELYGDSLRKALQRGEPFSLEYELRRSDGAYRWMVDSARPYTRDNEFAGFLGSIVDVTDHKSAENNLRAALQERDVLLREVHHRVKNNLQNLMAMVRFMRRTADPGGKSLLDTLYARLVSMSLVQHYLHAAENMTEVSVRTLLADVVPQLAESELGVPLQFATSTDLILPARAAAYVGLAVAEAIVLLSQSGASSIEIKLHTDPTPTVQVGGSAIEESITRSHLGMRLMRQYARAAGAEPELRSQGGDVCLVFVFPDEVFRRR